MKSITLTQLFETSKTLGPQDLILDVRTPEEFSEGHIPGARNIPVDEVEARANELQGVKQLYLYCRAGRRASTAAGVLEQKGLAQLGIQEMCVYDDGGFPDWEAQGYPVQKK